MTYESFEPMELATAEFAIECCLDEGPEEIDFKFSYTVAPYVEFEE